MREKDREKTVTECVKIVSKFFRDKKIPCYFDNPEITENPRKAEDHPFCKLINKS